MRKFWHDIANESPVKYGLFTAYLKHARMPFFVFQFLPVVVQLGVFVKFISACEYLNRFHELPVGMEIAIKMEFKVCSTGTARFADFAQDQIRNWFKMSSFIDTELELTPDFMKVSSDDLATPMEIYTP